jgi:pSer/pThr/pTyr-binding forkhead associated (FHA) protein
MRASLTVLSGPFAGQTIAVAHGKLLIGREVDCHLRPESSLVSRHHCVLLLDDYTLRVRDLGSKNGTFVNDHRIATSEVVLLQGDIVSVGDMGCQVEINSDVPAVAAPQLLEATGVFDGDTVQAKTTDSALPAAEPPASTDAP